LYKRSDAEKGGLEYSEHWLPYKYRHGLTPPMKNCRNVRFKKELTIEEKLKNKEEVKSIQKILQDII
jgi:TATA-binding protein-associated factor Taf7